MKQNKKFLISIKGVYTNYEDSDTIELFTTGDFYARGGNYYISYDETEATGFEGSRTTLKVEDSRRVTMERSGSSQAQLVIEKGVRHQCHYDMGYGDLMIGISGEKIKSSLTEQGGNLTFKYSLDVNSQLASEHEMYINIKESAN
ncbi:DUF1934 domain-containing protein [Oscillospiraceae bacterium MB08-C2-2]|nr:DUF1934 domain-containing protein [Oscillospiraceae bacterium MB08-C2-2]